MDDQQFWNIIAQSRNQAHNDCESQTARITDILKQYESVEIVNFRHIFDQKMVQSYLSHLWAIAYVAMGGCSDDGFDYFRAWLIGQGQNVFEQAIADIETLAPIIRDHVQQYDDYPECEILMYAPIYAYEHKTGQDDFYDLYQSHFERPIRPKIEFDWDGEDSLRKILPNTYDMLEDLL